jgi:signal transduction histidine kinase
MVSLPVPPSMEAAALPAGSLLHAFTSFAEAAASLERSYGELHAEVARLRRELEETNADLARSLDENRRVREHLHQILQGLPCGVLVMEAGGQVSVANPEARRLLGIGGPLDLQNTEAEWRRPIARALADTHEHEYSSASQAAHWIAVRHARLETAENSSSVFIVRDISESKRLAHLQDTLRRREALAEMAAVLAHEIRNPLASLELFAGLLVEEPLLEDQATWAKHVQAGLRTLAATVNNVLQFHSGSDSELRPLDLGALLDSFAEFVRPAVELSNIELQMKHELCRVQIRADRNRLQQVFFNLALNAVRFMPEGGVLRIAGGLEIRDSQAAVIEFRDTGTGIAPENLAHIFDAGFTTRAGSAGLGLAVSKNILDEHSARIEARPNAGAGTTFRLEFPVVEDEL